MSYKLGEYFRGFKPQDSTPQLTVKTETPKVSKSWASIPVTMWVDSTTGETKNVLLVAFSPKLRFVSKELAQQILKKYSGFKKIKFLPKRFLPCPVAEKIQVDIDMLIG